MTSPTDAATIRELSPTQDVDDPDLRAYVDVGNAVEADVLGSTMAVSGYADMLPHWWPNPYSEVTRLLAEVDGVAAGAGYLNLPTAENLETYEVQVEVLPEYRHRGLGRAMFERLSGRAEQAGRTVAKSWALSPPSRGDVLTARTGQGGVAADAPGTRFLLAAGYALEQVERMSRLDLDTDRLAGLVAAVDEARRAAGPDYRVLTWQGSTPDHRLEDMAWMRSRMSTDAPMGEVVAEEESWDADRVRDAERRESSADRVRYLAAAEHVPSGRLVAYTALSAPSAPSAPSQGDRAAWQNDTLVTREHRGHRLGMLVKAANLVELARQSPPVTGVITWNAEENRPMLDVNEALGFVPVGYEGVWQRTAHLAG